MKNITLEELKVIEVNMLEYIDKLCLENDIKYFVFWGTLIGTVRHNGFIPWDDDVDIIMTREDYNKFLKVLKENPIPKYKVFDHNIQEEYYYSYPKLVDTTTVVTEDLFDTLKDYGLFIDIFVLDKIPKDKNIQEKILKKIKIYQKLIYYYKMNISYEKNKVKKFLKIIIKKIIRIYGLNRINKKIRNLFSKYSNLDEYVYTYDSCESNSVFEANEIQQLIRHKFENIEINIPLNYDFLLKREYGNYMKLPPEEERKSNHKMKCYWKDK